MNSGLLRVLGHQHRCPDSRCLSANVRTSVLALARSFASGKDAGQYDATAKAAPEDDPVEVLRRIQQENQAKAAAMREKAPPAPPRHSGKTKFFEDRDDASRMCEDTVEPQKEDDSATPAAATRPVGRVMPRTRPSATASSPGPLAGPKTTASAAAARTGGTGKAVTGNPFMERLDKMEAESKSPAFPTYDAAAEKRRRHIEEKIKEERKRLLVFRDVGMDLDKPILSRDVFLVFKYFRYGAEFAVDNELERQLRYFNEHALNELKIIQDSKLMRGPPTLSKKRHTTTKRSVFSGPGVAGTAASGGASAAGGVFGPDSQGQHHNLASTNPTSAAPFQITSSFPQVRCANLLQFCPPFDPHHCTTLHGLLRPSAAQSTFAQYFTGGRVGTTNREDKAVAATATATPPKFDASSEAQMTTLSPSSFRRPAVVIYSQLGQKFGAECDEAWRRLAYSTICPGIVPYLAGGAPAAAFASPSSAAASHSHHHKSSPIDVVSLRSADLYKYRWVHALYVRRLAKTLSDTQHASTSADGKEEDKEGVRKFLTAASTFVGPRLLEPFYTTLGLRNYLLPQVMLVDHEGVVRWLSGGLPDAYEAEHFPALLKQLESEYYGTKRSS